MSRRGSADCLFIQPVHIQVVYSVSTTQRGRVWVGVSGPQTYSLTLFEEPSSP